ncbi:unnamed protein product [Linum trigynum]|uniref:Uncharacterized protein n=1 Tax=Linum trigynum TaxID=586398 RepID=A0AAV2EQJ1_9ROSI
MAGRMQAPRTEEPQRRAQQPQARRGNGENPHRTHTEDRAHLPWMRQNPSPRRGKGSPRGFKLAKSPKVLSLHGPRWKVGQQSRTKKVPGNAREERPREEVEPAGAEAGLQDHGGLAIADIGRRRRLILLEDSDNVFVFQGEVALSKAGEPSPAQEQPPKTLDQGKRPVADAGGPHGHYGPAAAEEHGLQSQVGLSEQREGRPKPRQRTSKLRKAALAEDSQLCGTVGQAEAAQPTRRSSKPRTKAQGNKGVADDGTGTRLNKKGPIRRLKKGADLPPSPVPIGPPSSIQGKLDLGPGLSVISPRDSSEEDAQSYELKQRSPVLEGAGARCEGKGHVRQVVAAFESGLILGEQSAAGDLTIGQGDGSALGVRIDEYGSNLPVQPIEGRKRQIEEVDGEVGEVPASKK